VHNVTYAEAISTGYAKDNGLFVPESVPTLSFEDIVALGRLRSFPEVATSIMRRFIAPDEIDDASLARIVTNAFSQFEHDEIIPLVKISGGEGESKQINPASPNGESPNIPGQSDLQVAELFHGPTQSFKDFGQQMLVGLLDYFAVRTGKLPTLVCATTGDTGPAAIHAVASSKNLKIVCGFPEGQITNLQRRQMTTVNAPGKVRVYAFQGGGDDMDVHIRRVSIDPDFASKYQLAGVNSINIARVTAQVCHFVWIYLRAVGSRLGPSREDSFSFNKLNPNEPLPLVFICIPTGAMGNVMAGYFAKMMGLPIALTCAVNKNDIVHRVRNTGVYDVRGEMLRTLSEAINCQCPYNFERMLYYISGQDAQGVSKFYEELAKTGVAKLQPKWHRGLFNLINTCNVTDDEMLDTIREYYTAHGYLSDPHTAVALTGVYKVGLRQSSRVPSQRKLSQADLKFIKASKGYWPLHPPSGVCSANTGQSNVNANANTKPDVCPLSGKTGAGCPFGFSANTKPVASPELTRTELQELTVVVMATAHPVKFEEAITKALGERVWRECFPELLPGFSAQASSKQTHSASTASASRSARMPASAVQFATRPELDIPVFRKSEDWESRLKELIADVHVNGRAYL